MLNQVEKKVDPNSQTKNLSVDALLLGKGSGGFLNRDRMGKSAS